MPLRGVCVGGGGGGGGNGELIGADKIAWQLFDSC